MAYSSKYYDPVKAHEYYMKHRQLKEKNARTSTAGLNDAGKVAAKEVREKIKEEKKAHLEALKEEMNGKISAIRDQIKALKGLPKEERKARATALREQIKGLREENKAKRAEATATFKEMFAQEMDKIKGSSEFKKASKKRGRKKKK